MYNPKLCLTVCCFVLFIKTLFSQNNLSEGYYVGFKKDTVHGFFNLDDVANKKILFYTNKTASTSKKLTPDDVSQIETHNKVSIRTLIYTYRDQREPLFITKYADGNVKLYKATSLNPDEPDVFFISSIKMPLIRKISAINPKTFLNTYFKGCELATNFSVKYDGNSLLAAVTEISKCAYPNVEIEKNIGKHTKIYLELGFKMAVCVNNSVLKGWANDPKLKTNVNPLFGVIVGLDVSQSFKFYTGLNYFRRDLMGKDSVKVSYFTSFTGSISYTNPPFKMSTNFLEIPIAMHYEFNKNNPTYIPKLILGAAILTPLKTKYERDFNYTGKFVDASNGLYASSRINPSFFIGGGVKKILKNNSIIDLNLKYSFETDDPTDSGRFYSDRYELSLNYLFSLSKK
jgi:hypothetical protein